MHAASSVAWYSPARLASAFVGSSALDSLALQLGPEPVDRLRDGGALASPMANGLRSPRGATLGRGSGGHHHSRHQGREGWRLSKGRRSRASRRCAASPKRLASAGAAGLSVEDRCGRWEACSGRFFAVSVIKEVCRHGGGTLYRWRRSGDEGALGQRKRGYVCT